MDFVKKCRAIRLTRTKEFISNLKGLAPKLTSTDSPGVLNPTVGYKSPFNPENTYSNEVIVRVQNGNKKKIRESVN